MHLQLGLEVILAGLDVAGNLRGALPLHARQHLTGRPLLPVDDRATQADAPEVGIHSPDAHALNPSRESQHHLREGHQATGGDAPTRDPDQATPLRGTREHLLYLVRAGAVRRIIARLHAREKGREADVMVGAQRLPLDAVMLAREGNELGGTGSLRERNAHARLLADYWSIV